MKERWLCDWEIVHAAYLIRPRCSLIITVTRKIHGNKRACSIKRIQSNSIPSCEKSDHFLISFHSPHFARPPMATAAGGAAYTHCQAIFFENNCRCYGKQDFSFNLFNNPFENTITRSRFRYISRIIFETVVRSPQWSGNKFPNW